MKAKTAGPQPGRDEARPGDLREGAGQCGRSGAAEDAGETEGAETGAGEEEVVDAEFSEVDDENKG